MSQEGLRDIAGMAGAELEAQGRRARVYIAYTGGTIGMQKTPRGYRPAPGHLQALMDKIPAMHSPLLPDYVVHQYDPLLDSADMAPGDWLKIAEDIAAVYDDFDGFLVVHGTDTMAYSAAALSFMLEGLNKPVILTGAQLPLEELRSDAQDNLLGALIFLQRYHAQLSEVFVYFNRKLFRGNRVTKVDANQFDAFDSPNFPVVGQAGIRLRLDFDKLHAPIASKLAPSVTPIGEATVAAFRLFPGLRAEYLSAILAPPVQGVVLECFGSGNAPDRNRPLMEAIRAACARGVVVVAVRQPLRGSAELGVYATGRALLDAGVVSGLDMTAEAALAKLFYLFAKGTPPTEVRALLGENLRGEQRGVRRPVGLDQGAG